MTRPNNSEDSKRLNMEGFDTFLEDITKWDVLREMIDLDPGEDIKNESSKPSPGVKRLPRQDVSLYGSVPKMEQRIYTKCKECRLIFNPRDVLSHKSCSGKDYSSSSLAHSLRKKSKSNTPKKSHSSLPPPPLFKKSPSPTSILSSNNLPELLPKISPTKMAKVSSSSSSSNSHSSSVKSDVRPSSTLSPSKSSSYHSPKSPKSNNEPSSKSSSKNNTQESINSSSTSNSSSSNSSRHKKSRKTNSSSSVKPLEVYDLDIHCGVVEGNKSPCIRSITCSNHRIQLRKLVQGRSKDIHQLIAERKTMKEKDGKYTNSSSVYTSPNGLEAQDVQTAYVPAPTNSRELTNYIPILPKTSDLTTSTPTLTEIENKFSKTADVQINTQESAVGTVPVVYMPISPISVMSPVEFVKIGKNIICLESPQSATSPPITSNQSVFLTIPSHQQNIKMYKSHPKPAAVPTYGTKKIGGAILLSNQRIESQRNDILLAINSNRKTINNIQGYRTISSLNHTNSLHRPNILKTKGSNRVNCKRSAVDKLNSSDSKQVKLAPNLNGFVLHSDISESADAPQSNNCIQDKPFYNLK